MIPKIIHYCWFGGNEMPPLVQKCINSWKEHLLLMNLNFGMKKLSI